MDPMRFDKDRAISVFLIVGTILFLVELAFPDLMRPVAERYFDWGAAEIVGTAGWMALSISGIVGAVAGYRRSVTR